MPRPQRGRGQIKIIITVTIPDISAYQQCIALGSEIYVAKSGSGGWFLPLLFKRAGPNEKINVPMTLPDITAFQRCMALGSKTSVSGAYPEHTHRQTNRQTNAHTKSLIALDHTESLTL